MILNQLIISLILTGPTNYVSLCSLLLFGLTYCEYILCSNMTDRLAASGPPDSLLNKIVHRQTSSPLAVIDPP